MLNMLTAHLPYVHIQELQHQAVQPTICEVGIARHHIIAGVLHGIKYIALPLHSTFIIWSSPEELQSHQ